MSLRGSIVARIPDTSACPSEITQQKRKLRIYISNTYTPSKPEGEEAEKVSSWELRVEGKLLEEVSLKKKKKHIRVFSLLSRCGLTASISVSLIVFLQTWVGQCSWLRLRSQMCVYSFSHSTPQLLTHTHTQDLIWNTELKPLAVAYHELTSLPSRHQF